MYLDSCEQLWVLVVHQLGEVTAIIQDHVEGLTIREEDSLLNAPGIKILIKLKP
jgi:hypothetical protein